MTELNFEQLFEAVPGLYLILSPDFTILAVTDSYLNATLTKRNEIIGKNIFEVFPDNPEAPGSTATASLRLSLNIVCKNKVIDTMAVQKYDIPLPESMGGGFEERYWSPINIPVLDADNNLLYIIHRVEDVTKFIKLEQQGTVQQSLNKELETYKNKMEAEVYLRSVERKNALEQLHLAKLEAEKLAKEAILANQAKSIFLASMSHEIRTPLNGIIGMADLLMLMQQPPEQRDYTETIRYCGETLLKTINDILDFSKIESGYIEIENTDFNLRDLIESILESVALRAHIKGIAIGGLIDNNVPVFVNSDPTRIGQIIKNLLDNAVKFTSVGEVSLNVRLAQLQNSSSDKVNISFEVDDTGIGMTSEAMQRIFNPFTQGDTSITRKYGGTGLGLVICKRLVELLGGNISVSSTAEQGSKFTFILPLQKSNQETLPIVDNFLPELHNLRVLAVDDNQINRQVVEAELRAWGMRCDLVDNGADALNILREAARVNDPYTIALLDCMMPVMDGIELSKNIMAIPEISNTRIIMLTSIGLATTTDELNKAGVKICLTKPVRQSKLYNSILAVLKSTNIDTRKEQLSNKNILKDNNYLDKNILIVDDNPTNQEVAKRMLKYLGFYSTVASNGIEAIECLRKQKFDLIFMDCQMPEMDGYNATQQILKIEADEHLKHTPVIGMTAHALIGDREKCIESGMDDYISKPVKMGILQAMLEKWLNLAASSNKAEPSKKPNTEAIIDFERLEQIFLGDKDGLRNFMHTFCSVSLESVRGVEIAVHEREFEKAKDLVHSLLGSCGNAGANQMYAVAKQLEQNVLEQNWEIAHQLVDKLKILLQELVVFIKQQEQ